jgi:hypothetical protein
MIDQLSPRARRFLALGLLAVLGLALDTAVLAPWRAQRAALSQQIASDRAAIQRYRTALATLDAEVKAIQALRESPLRAAFLGGASGALPTTELQELIKSAAEQERIAIDSLQILPGREVAGIGRQGLAIAFEARFPAVLRLIHAIEGTTPLVRLARLELQSAAAEDGVLSVALTAEGLVSDVEQ